MRTMFLLGLAAVHFAQGKDTIGACVCAIALLLSLVEQVRDASRCAEEDRGPA